MEGEAHNLTLEARLSQHLVAIQKLNDKIAQLGERNKPQGRPSPHGERRFGDAPEAGYVEPKLPILHGSPHIKHLALMNT